MKKLGVMITAFNEERFIQPVVKQFDEIIDDVIVTVSAKPWHGDIEPDGTLRKARGIGKSVFSFNWKNEAEQRNWSMDHLSECSYVLVCHTDTFFIKEDIKKIKEFIQTATERQYDIESKMYWKDLDTIVKPDPLLRAMLIRNDVRFVENIRIEDMSTTAPIVPDVICHHLSWAKTDNEVKTKLATYGHAKEIIPNWYEEVWLKDKDTDFAPTNPSDYKSKEKYSCPDEIRRYFEN